MRAMDATPVASLNAGEALARVGGDKGEAAESLSCGRLQKNICRGHEGLDILMVAL